MAGAIIDPAAAETWPFIWASVTIHSKQEDMAIIAMFEVNGATSSKYEEVICRLTTIGQRVPDGQMYHICYGDKQRLQVIDVFESQAKLDAFGAKLMPILKDLGIEAKPSVFEVYNIIEGQ